MFSFFKLSIYFSLFFLASNALSNLASNSVIFLFILHIHSFTLSLTFCLFLLSYPSISRSPPSSFSSPLSFLCSLTPIIILFLIVPYMTLSYRHARQFLAFDDLFVLSFDFSSFQIPSHSICLVRLTFILLRWSSSTSLLLALLS